MDQGLSEQDKKTLWRAVQRWDRLGDKGKRFASLVSRWGRGKVALSVLSCAAECRDAEVLENALHATNWIYESRRVPARVAAAMKDLAFSAMASADRRVRQIAVDCLELIPNYEREKADALFRMLLDRAKGVRVAAGWAVAALGPSAIPRLVRALRDSRYDKVGSTFNILMALDWLLQELTPARTRRLTRQIGERLPDIRDDESQWKASETLGKHIGGEIGAQVLTGLIVRHTGKVRRLCADGMLYVEPSVARKHLLQLANHPNRSVRVVAKQRLKKLRATKRGE